MKERLKCSSHEFPPHLALTHSMHYLLVLWILHHQFNGLCSPPTKILARSCDRQALPRLHLAIHREGVLHHHLALNLQLCYSAAWLTAVTRLADGGREQDSTACPVLHCAVAKLYRIY